MLSSLITDPVSIAWVALGICLVWLLVRKQRWLGAVLGILWLGGVIGQVTQVPERLLASLERPYYGQRLEDLPPADAVVVCGGFLRASTNDLAGVDFSDAADRLLTGIQLMREGKARTLVLGGGTPNGSAGPLEADLAEQWMRKWDLPEIRILKLGRCRNTHDEAMRTRDLAQKEKWTHIILVTSACHMNRAAGTFRKAGLEVVPAAADFRGSSLLEGNGERPFLPNFVSCDLLNAFVHELVGIIYYRQRAWM